MIIRAIVSLTLIMMFLPSPTVAAESAAEDTLTLEPQKEARDVVYLKNGSIIRGTILEMIPDSTIRIQTGDGNVFVYPTKEVERITKEEPPPLRGRPAAQLKKGPKPTTQLAGLIGYGTVDGYNLGFGLRIGATFASGFYLGGTFVYHTGKTEEASIYTGFGIYTFKVTANCLYVGAELGSETRVSDGFVIRPYSGLGYFLAIANVESGGGSSSGSEARFFFAPGLLLNILPSQQATIGLDARYVIVTGEGGSNANSFGIFLALGLIL